MYPSQVSLFNEEHINKFNNTWTSLECFQVPEPIKIKKSGGHGHSHDPSQMNMRGAFLHVLSDALGSVIVVISALVGYPPVFLGLEFRDKNIYYYYFADCLVNRMGISLLYGSSIIHCFGDIDFEFGLAIAT